MKIKIFKGFTVNNLESKVNEFIQDKEVVDIKQSAVIDGFTGGTTELYIVITVMYK